MEMKPDDAYALRMALEPVTHTGTGYDGKELALYSIAISLKRIADALDEDSPAHHSARRTE
jgi:hypothetical protein